MLNILSYPFFQNALISIILLSFVLPLLGIFLVLKRGVFIADALAHSSLLSIGISFLLGLNYLSITLIYLIFCAIILYFIEKYSSLNYDLIIMIIAILGMAGGVLLFSAFHFAKASLVSFLFGNILLIDKQDIIILSIVFLLILILFNLYSKKTLLTFINRDMAYTENVKVDYINLFFIIILSLVIGVSIKIVGVLLASSLLVIPVSIAKLTSQSFKELTISSILWAEILGISGLFISYFLNLPPGPTIALLGILVLTFIYFLSKITVSRN